MFCGHNPIMFADPWGLYRVNIIDYVTARGATVREFTGADGRARAEITYGDTTRTWFLNSGFAQDFNLHASLGMSSFLTEADRAAGVGIVIVDGRLFKNFTTPINNALASTIATAQGHQRRISNSILINTPLFFIPSPNTFVHMARMASWFYDQVDHGAPWDIKLDRVWNQTIAYGTFPGVGVQVYFRGWLMTPEQLGNFTFGYIGAAAGLTHAALIGGSIYAAPLGSLAQIRNEISDWRYVTRGFNAWRGR